VNIGEAVKTLQIKYPSASISRIRFLEKEGLINIKRSSGGTRKFTNKDIEKISKIIDLQENEFYSLKAIKNNPSLLKKSKSKSIKINNYSSRDMLKQSGLSNTQFENLVSFGFEEHKEIYNNDDLNRMKSWSFFYSLGLEPKNFSVLKSISERSNDFIEFITSLLTDENEVETNTIVENYVNLIRSYSLKHIS
jgi:DNA-binding transcriptional MerR regulator